MSAEGERPAIALEAEPPLQLAFVVLAVVGLLAFGLLSEGGRGSGVLRMSREAPDFTLNLFDGGTFTLSENRGQPVVMNIWASWCHSCREEAPVLEQGWRSYRDQGVTFVGVNVMDTRGDAEAFLEEFDITYPNGPDEGDIYFDYGTTGVPETFFINRDGVIVVKFFGPLSPEQLSALVEELLQ
jgi:cytochrome c biogenesis protein CcmG/thiol:disulfide interchange protein DsbE